MDLIPAPPVDARSFPCPVRTDVVVPGGSPAADGCSNSATCVLDSLAGLSACKDPGSGRGGGPDCDRDSRFCGPGTHPRNVAAGRVSVFGARSRRLEPATTDVRLHTCLLYTSPSPRDRQ